MLVAALIVLGAISIAPALTLVRKIRGAEHELGRAQAALAERRFRDAATGFSRARDAFDEAARQPGNALLRMGAILPVAGRTPDALLSIAEIGRDLSRTAARVSARLDRLPGGLGALAPVAGRIRLGPLATVAPDVHAARLAVDGALTRASRLPTAWVPEALSATVHRIRSELERVSSVTTAADEMLRVLPEFAGADGRPRRYFLAPQNLTEARGTGGLIGNFAILTMAEGQMRVGRFSDIGSLRNVPPSRITPPSREFARLYDVFGGAGFWLNLNMTPHAPLAASLIERLFERVRGERLDGTIFIDLVALSKMMEVTGPVEVPRLGATLTPGNVLRFVAEAEYLTDIPEAPTVGPRLVAQAVLGRFFSSKNPEAALLALVESAAGGHIAVHARDPRIQAALERAGLAGRFGPDRAGGDFFAVVTNNAAANKVDFYMRRRLGYDVRLIDDGRAVVQATLRLANRAPRGAKPSYSLGPNRGLDLAPGENQSWLSFYCPPGCSLRSATDGGRPARFLFHREMGLHRFSRYVRVEAGETRIVRLSLELRDVWTGDRSRGGYRLRIQAPPAVAPLTGHVVVRVPEQAKIAWAGEPMRADEGVARWSGPLPPRQDVEVRFAQPAPRRLLTRLLEFLDQPLF